MANMCPYLRFNGNCREAMTFYKDCLGGELMLQTVGETPMGTNSPESEKAKVMHSHLGSEDFALMGSDMMDASKVEPGNVYSLAVICHSKAEIESLFSKFAQGGQITHPLKEEFFGTYGDLTDKFGISWMFQFTPAMQG
jgi:PhnB protein